jgi:hypothetical protein
MSPNRTVRAAPVVVLLSVAIFAVVACSDSPRNPPSATPAVLGGASNHAIHVFLIDPGGGRREVDFGQATEIGSASGDSIRSASNPSSNIHSLTFDGGTPVQSPATLGNASTSGAIDATAWSLAERASTYCSQIGNYAYAAPAVVGDIPWSDVDIAQFFFYSQNGDSYAIPNSCSERLQLEENLLCVADQLGAIADAVGTTVWPALETNCGTPFEYGADAGTGSAACDEWDIPPQATSDQFIVRDLAIHTLGVLATLDAMPVDATEATGQATSTCATLFGETAEVASTNAPNTTPVTPTPLPIGPNDSNKTNVLFATEAQGCQTTGTTGTGCFPLYPPSAVPIYDPVAQQSNAPTIARSALQIEAQIMRAGGRLLHDLVRRDVYADLASAAQQEAQALDPAQGNVIAWGQDANAGPYGTYAHAARVLAGRWEIGDLTSDFTNHGDPQCGGALAINILGSAFGPDLAARVADTPIRTSGQALAAQLVSESGIVLPSCKITDAPTLRAALASQLQIEQIARNNDPNIPLAAFTQTVAGLQDADVLFGFSYALHTYELVTNLADPSANGGVCAPLPLTAGLSASSSNATFPSVSTDLMGIVVQGGIDRSRLKTDPIARSGGLLAASECPENGDGTWNEWGTSLLTQLSFASTPLPKVVFQDAFHIGQAFERRLGELAIAASPVAGPDQGDPESVALGGMAEVRSWAGSIMVHAWGADSASNGLTVQIAGDDYSDLGLSASTPMALRQPAIAAAYGFVYGPPWAAECAAHVRTDCPTNFDTTWVQHATSVVDNEDLNPPVDYTDIDGVITPVFTLSVPYNAGNAGIVANFNPPPQTGAPPKSLLYVVRLSVPSNPMRQGAVLGVIAPVFNRNLASGQLSLSTNIVDFVVSPMQRELLDDTIDLGKWVGARPPTVGDLTAADSPGYCVDGVSRDVFVPLQNQLTEGATGDSVEQSWQYYLNIAQTAAATADTLGQQLLNLDFQTTQNEQAAGEAVAGLCGDYGALSETTVTPAGQVIPSASDPTLTSCLTSQNTDIVFLGPVPAALASSSTPTQWLQQNVLQCASTGATDPNCASTVTKLTYDTLGLVKAQPATSTTQACQQLPAVIASRSSNFTGTAFSSVLGDPLFGTSSMNALANSLSMNVDLWGNWNVVYANSTIMDSTSSSLWPGCLRGSQCATAQTGMPYLLNTAFRYCPTGPGSTQAITDPTQLLQAPLGCDPGTGDPATAELNILKWRVAGALWMVAASAGGMPSGMFNMPVPVVYLPASDGNGGLINTFVGAAYPATRLLPAGPVTGTNGGATLEGYTQQAVEGVVSDEDAVTMGTVYDMAPAWSAFAGNAANEIPAWYMNLYSGAAASYTKQAQISNTSLNWTNCQVGWTINDSECAYANGQPNFPYNPLPVSFNGLLNNGAFVLDGFVCPQRWGTPPQGDPGRSLIGTFSQTVTALKTGYDNGAYYYWSQQPGDSPPPYDLYAACGQAGANNDLAVTLSGPACPFSDWPQPANPLWVGSNPVGGLTSQTFITATDMPPSRRAFAFANLTAENGACNALSQMLDAAAVACAAQREGVGTAATSTPPKVTSIGDIGVLDGWLAMMSSVVEMTVQDLYAEEVPTRVVSDFKTGQVGSGDKSGTYGTDILNMEQSFQDLPTSWSRIGSDLNAIELAIATAQEALQGAQLGDQDALTTIAINEISAQAQMAQATVAFYGSLGTAGADAAVCAVGVTATGGASAATCAGVPAAFTAVGVAASAQSQSISAGTQELAQYTAQVNQAKDNQNVQVATALITLNTTTTALWTDVQTSLDNLRKDVLAIMAAASDLQLTQNKASYEAAVATGADSVMIAGQEVAIPINTVLNRQASATQIRYQNALTNAKALAYMARRAIEQRIGIPLSALTSPVGPLDPPATWADDVCSLTGIDYASLSTPTSADAGGQGSAADQAVITQFSNQFVGDYVTKLSDFVTYFNVQYPSHEGDDTAVLSLRYDLMNPVHQCLAPAANLLLESGQLADLLSPGAAATQQGWMLGSCAPGASKCLAAITGGVLQPPDGPAGALASSVAGTGVVASIGDTGVTWLLDVPGGATGNEDGGVAADGGGGGGAASVAPAGIVYQAVPLQGGAYVLSWWDQARDSSGALLASAVTPVAYVVRVYDQSWQQIAAYNNTPYVVGAGGGSLWSQRLALSFTAAAQGTYYIAFAASTADEGVGSVAVADVQLEASTGSGLPSPYAETGTSTMVTSYNCPPSDSDMRSTFQHSCDASGTCWYDLSTPIIIDTQQLENGTSPISSKLAPGNYNFRHVDLAVNLVGTDVHDCSSSPTPACYGTGYIQYTLQHDGTNSGILDWNGNSRIFDFGIASINSGKALAAERYITTPLASADQALISQPGIQHVELQGRPLDGVYYLRIWDSPNLNWNNLQDIQLVLDYEYWSEIVANGNAQGQ